MNDETQEFFLRNLRHIFVAVGMAGYFLFVLWVGSRALELSVMLIWGAVVVALYNLVDKYLMDSGHEQPRIHYQFEQSQTTVNVGRNVLNCLSCGAPVVEGQNICAKCDEGLQDAHDEKVRPNFRSRAVATVLCVALLLPPLVYLQKPRNAPIEFNTGLRVEQGHDAPKDDAQAVIWYRKAADSGLAQAQSKLGVMYAEGRGVAKDYDQAAFWFRKAADQGDANAQTNIGLLYERGLGVSQDDTEAMRWFRKAAEQGNAVAKRHLSELSAVTNAPDN